MKKLILTLLALGCIGVTGAARADDSGALLAARNAALLASGSPVRLCPVYYYEGVRYHNRRVVAYKTVKITTISGGVRYVRYKRVPVYRYW